MRPKIVVRADLFVNNKMENNSTNCDQAIDRVSKLSSLSETERGMPIATTTFEMILIVITEEVIAVMHARATEQDKKLIMIIEKDDVLTYFVRRIYTGNPSPNHTTSHSPPPSSHSLPPSLILSSLLSLLLFDQRRWEVHTTIEKRWYALLSLSPILSSFISRFWIWWVHLSLPSFLLPIIFLSLIGWLPLWAHYAKTSCTLPFLLMHLPVLCPLSPSFASFY